MHLNGKLKSITAILVVIISMFLSISKVYAVAYIPPSVVPTIISCSMPSPYHFLDDAKDKSIKVIAYVRNNRYAPEIHVNGKKVATMTQTGGERYEGSWIPESYDTNGVTLKMVVPCSNGGYLVGGTTTVYVYDYKIKYGLNPKVKHVIIDRGTQYTDCDHYALGRDISLADTKDVIDVITKELGYTKLIDKFDPNDADLILYGRRALSERDYPTIRHVAKKVRNKNYVIRSKAGGTGPIVESYSIGPVNNPFTIGYNIIDWGEPVLYFIKK